MLVKADVVRKICKLVNRRGGLPSVHLTQLTLFLTFLLSLAILSMEYDGPGLRRNFPRLELPLVAAVYATLFFLLRPGRFRAVLAALPIYLFYLFYIVYFLSLDRTFKLADIGLLPELIGVLPSAYGLLMVAGISGVLLVYARAIRPASFTTAAFGCLPVATLLCSVYFAPKLYLALFNSVAVGASGWSEGRSAGDNGFIAMVLYHQARQTLAKQDLAGIRDENGYRLKQEALGRYLARHGSARNVHIIVLESFFDPRDLAGLRFSRSPIHEALDELVADNRSTIISPVFGGATAQVEFEALCATPAFGHYESIEFNVFTGSKAHCLPELLRPSGYRLVASNAFKPFMFNSLKAYQGTGFDEVYYPAQYTPNGQSYFSLQSDDEFLFDGDFLAQNLEFVVDHISREDARPLLNYVIGIYGHTPHRLVDDQVARIEVARKDQGKVSSVLERFVNQVYYRTEALATHLALLMAADPESLIIVFGDHLPVLGGVEAFHELGYMDNLTPAARRVPAYLFVDGRSTRVDTLHAYELPQLVLDYLTGGRYCRDYACDSDRRSRLESYREVMASATR